MSGTVQSRFASRRLRCKGKPTPFTAYRAGTPNAPHEDATMATGVYDGVGNRVALTLQVIAPGRELVRGEIEWRPRCRNGSRVAITEVHRRFWLSGDALVIRWRRREREDGLVARKSTVLRVRFSNDRGQYVMAGRVRATARYFKGGRLVETCKIDTPVSGFIGD